MSFEQDDTEQEDAAGAHRTTQAWGLMLLLGWVAFEVTAQPRYGIAVTCSKFAWNDLLSGLWWRRVDPIRGRGLVGLFLCLSRGVFKWAGATLATCMLLMTFLDARGPQALQQSWVLSFAIGIVLVVIASLLSGVAVATSLASGSQLWIDRGLTASRRRDQFPSLPEGSNTARAMVIASALVCGTVFAVITGLLGKTKLAEASPALALGMMWALQNRFASSGEEFWSVTESPDPSAT